MSPSFRMSILGIPDSGGVVHAHPIVRGTSSLTHFAVVGLFPVSVALTPGGAVDLSGPLDVPDWAEEVQKLREAGHSEPADALHREYCARQARERVLTWLRAPEVTAMVYYISNHWGPNKARPNGPFLARVAAAMLWGPLALRDESIIRPEHLPDPAAFVIQAVEAGHPTLGTTPPSVTFFAALREVARAAVEQQAQTATAP